MNEQVTPEEIDARNIVEGKVQATEEEKQRAAAFLAQVEADRKAADNITDEEEKKSFLTRAKKGWQNWKNKYVASGDDLGKQLESQMGDAYDEKVDESIRKSEAMNKVAGGIAGELETAGIDTNESIPAIDNVQKEIKNAGKAKKAGGNTQETLVNNLTDNVSTGDVSTGDGEDTTTDDSNSIGNSGSATKDAKKIIENADIPKGDKNNRHYKAVKSIWSAYYDGDFGEPGSKEAKEVAWYYTIDSLAKLGNKIGKSLRNVGAAYTGGAIDTSEDEKSEWAKNRETLRNEATSMTQEDMGGKASRQKDMEVLRNQAQSIANSRGVTVNQLIDETKQKAEKAKADGNDQLALAYLGLAASFAGQPVSGEQMLAMEGMSIFQDIRDKGLGQTISGLLGL